MPTKFQSQPQNEPLELDLDQPHRNWIAVVNESFRQQNWPALELTTVKRGPDHSVLWEVTPTILGEVNYAYTASALRVDIAKNMCAQVVAVSGFCPVIPKKKKKSRSALDSQPALVETEETSSEN